MSERVVQIQAPHFTAGLVLRQNPTLRWRCVEAAPILKWAVGKSEDDLREYFSRRNWMWGEDKP